MEKNYWRRRRTVVASLARSAALSRAHAFRFEGVARDGSRQAGDPPFLFSAARSSAGESLALGEESGDETCADAQYFAELEEGAEFLAERTSDPAARAEHLRMARLYRDRAADALRVWRK